ncbi:MAG TPA: hypothetical protein VIE43_21995 [Thermoanaerobaculia bacterium]|jgi:hypothetical protein|nr:hypothetical protein [Thermoanaerobaculia bacterium]
MKKKARIRGHLMLGEVPPPPPGINARATMEKKSRLKPAQIVGEEIEPPSGGFLVET